MNKVQYYNILIFLSYHEFNELNEEKGKGKRRKKADYKIIIIHTHKSIDKYTINIGKNVNNQLFFSLSLSFYYITQIEEPVDCYLFPFVHDNDNKVLYFVFLRE